MRPNLLPFLKKAADCVVQGRLKEAEAIYRELLAEIPGLPDALYGLYRVYLARGKHEEAQDYLKESLCHLSLTVSADEKNRRIFERRLEEWKKLTGKEDFTDFPITSKVHPHQKKIEGLAKKKKWKNVVELVEKSRKKFGFSVQVLKAYFDALRNLGQFEKAGEVGFSLARFLDNDFEFWMNLGTVFIQSGRLYSAIKAYVRAKKIDSENWKPHYNLGVLALETEQYHIAEHYLKKSLELNPDHFFSWVNLAFCFKATFFFEELVKTLDKGAEHYKDIYAQGLGLLFDAGAYDRCLKALERKEEVLKKRNPQAVASVLSVEAALKPDRVKETLEFLKKILPVTKTKPAKTTVLKVKKQLDSVEKVVTLFPLGRSGSLFFHSLIDGHPQVATIPGVYLKGFFGLEAMRMLLPQGNSWHNEITQRLLRVYEAVFDATSPAPVPGDPMSGKINLGKQCGLTNMGEDRKTPLQVDKKVFSKIFTELIKPFKNLSHGDLFKIFHFAWEGLRKGEVLPKKVLFYHIHNPSFLELTNFLNHFPQTLNLFIVRQPIQSTESWVYNSFPPEEAIEKLNNAKEETRIWMLRQTYGKGVNKFQSVLVYCLGQMRILPEDKLFALRLEDLKEYPREMMQKVADWMGIDFDESLLKSDFMGLAYWGPSSRLHKNLRGFDKSNIKRKIGVLFSEKDVELLRVLFYPWLKKFGYADEPFPEQEKIEYALKLSEEVMDWEARLLNMLGFEKKDVELVKDVFEKRKNIFHYTLQNLKRIEKDLEKVNMITLDRK